MVHPLPLLLPLLPPVHGLEHLRTPLPRGRLRLRLAGLHLRHDGQLGQHRPHRLRRPPQLLQQEQHEEGSDRGGRNGLRRYRLTNSHNNRCHSVYIGRSRVFYNQRSGRRGCVDCSPRAVGSLVSAW